jgi:hypothetical protein
MNSAPVEILRNEKQALFLDLVLDNVADEVVPGKGGYQRGFTAFLQAGRAFGKTFTLLDLIAISAWMLPKALAGLGAKTFKQVLEIVLGQAEKVWSQYDLSEYDSKENPRGNYVLNKRPPAHFKKPYTSPKTYENSITFANGYTLMMMSADRPATTRGISLDQYFHDEFAFSNPEFYTDIIKPGIRANKYIYKDLRAGRKGCNHPLHWLSAFFSSAPRTLEGAHIYNYEALSKKYPTRYAWLEGTAYDNIENLPGDMINSMKEDMLPLAFEIEVLNRRPKRIDSAFYSAFDAKKHCYSNFGYKYNEDNGLWGVNSNDYDKLKPLEISFDFNADFTCMLIGQDHNKEFRVLDEIWVKESTTDLVNALTDKFKAKYSAHLKKTVFLYGDHGGTKRNAGSNKTFFDTIIQKLRQNKEWIVFDQVQKSYPPFASRYKVLNALLSESDKRFPRIRINEIQCSNLILSLQYTETIKNTFEKNKKAENNKSIPAEQATHLSDAFDYLLFKKYSSLIESSSARSTLPTV